jgi:hypothetical protein
MRTLDKYILFADRKNPIRLSFAVALIDEYTGKRPIGDVRVFIQDQNLKALKNLSGYFFFLDLLDGTYQVQVESEHYFERQITVNVPEPDPLNPVESITLMPTPSYPFPSGSTLIRGMVQDSDGNPVSEATVRVEGIEKEVNNTTTDKGEFVLYITALTEDDIIIVIDEEKSKRFVKGNSDKIIHLRATHDSKTGTFDLPSAEEGKTTSLGSPIIIS